MSVHHEMFESSIHNNDSNCKRNMRIEAASKPTCQGRDTVQHSPCILRKYLFYNGRQDYPMQGITWCKVLVASRVNSKIVSSPSSSQIAVRSLWEFVRLIARAHWAALAHREVASHFVFWAIASFSIPALRSTSPIAILCKYLALAGPVLRTMPTAMKNKVSTNIATVWFKSTAFLWLWHVDHLRVSNMDNRTHQTWGSSVKLRRKHEVL